MYWISALQQLRVTRPQNHQILTYFHWNIIYPVQKSYYFHWFYSFIVEFIFLLINLTVFFSKLMNFSWFFNKCIFWQCLLMKSSLTVSQTKNTEDSSFSCWQELQIFDRLFKIYKLLLKSQKSQNSVNIRKL